MDHNEQSERPRQRLTPQDRNRELLPLRRAQQLTSCCVYWLPVTAFPAPAAQRNWMLLFLEHLSQIGTAQMGLREEIFLQMKAATAPDIRNAFFGSQQEFLPVPGLARRPGSKLPPEPTMKDVQDLQDGRKKFDTNDYVPDYCHWFLNRSSAKIRERLFGYGAMTIGFVPPDPNTTPPRIPNLRALREGPLMQQADINGKIEMAYALKNGFLAKSKKLFGADLADDVGHSQMLFVIPWLGAQDFFRRPPVEIAAWFDLFPLYVTESPIDHGLVIASKIDLDDRMIELLNQMKAAGLQYPEMAA
jgi:hypothetical protein